MNYRIDFSRLARTEDEIRINKRVNDFVEQVLEGSERAVRSHKDFQGSLVDGHILDTMTIEGEKEDLYGVDILEMYVKPNYPEAKLLLWDTFID